MNAPKFAVSLMCMDFAAAGQQVATLSTMADAFHLDIMDGHFAPNLSLSPDWVKALAPFSSIPLEAHLMTEHPDQWIEPLVAAGVHTLSPHAETLNRNAYRVMNLISSQGCRTGLVLNPMTPISQVKHLLPRVDLLTLMTVDVGFAGQPFITEMLAKITEAAEFREQEGLNYEIQIDGSCNEKTFQRLRNAGADIFILGTSGLFSLAEELTEAWQLMSEGYQRVTGESTLVSHA
ncbi:MAG: D-allulose 6-phosphate 3-epimerase [Propionicimonas sp.]